MIQTSIDTYNLLHNDAGVTAIVHEDIFPLLADQDCDYPFITYHVAERPSISKNGATEFTITVRSFEISYNKALTLAAAVKNAFSTAAQQYHYLGAEPKTTEGDEIYVEQLFNVKK